MFKALIIEDEKPAARRLQRMVEENNLEVVDLLHSVSQSITWFESHPAPDLIFLDIQLSDGISFEILRKLKSIHLLFLLQPMIPILLRHLN
jgi:two-component system response regulator LytT